MAAIFKYNTDIYLEYTDERYKALYNRIKRMSRKYLENVIHDSRDKDAGFETARLVFDVHFSLHQNVYLTEAVNVFDQLYPLWFSISDILKTIEPVRQKMYSEYWKQNNRDLSAWTTKTTKRLKIFGFIPTKIPLEDEVFDEYGELVQIKKYEYDFDLTKVSAFLKAKSDEEKYATLSEIRSCVTESPKPIILGNVISVEPTIKWFFHAITKYMAFRDLANELRALNASDLELGEEIHQIAIEHEAKQNEVQESEHELIDSDSLELSVNHTRTQQAAAFYFLLSAAGVKDGFNNRTEFARFLALMSAYKVEEGKNITNSPVYSTLVRNMSGHIWYSKSTLELVKKRFVDFNRYDSSELLNKAVELIDNDMKDK